MYLRHHRPTLSSYLYHIPDHPHPSFQLLSLNHHHCTQPHNLLVGFTICHKFSLIFISRLIIEIFFLISLQIYFFSSLLEFPYFFLIFLRYKPMANPSSSLHSLNSSFKNHSLYLQCFFHYNTRFFVCQKKY